MSKRSQFALILTAVAIWLCCSSSLDAQITVSDSNFSPATLSSGLTAPFGVTYRATSTDLVVAQSGINQVSMVNALTGATKAFVSQPTPYEVAFRSSDGMVAVTMRSTDRSADQVDFYSSTGSLLGSITSAAFSFPNTTCMTGLAFDSGGNLYLAAGVPSGGVPFGCLSTLFYFAGPTPWTASPVNIAYFNDDKIEGIAFNPVPAPYGSLYAVSSNNGDIFQVLPNPTCPTCSGLSLAGTAPPNSLSSSVAIDPLLGDVYITGTTGGVSAIYRMAPPSGPEAIQATAFATGSAAMMLTGISFDNGGNLYVNDAAGGNLWKLARNAFSTPIVPIVQNQNLNFTNPNASMSDQTQTIFIPQSANLNGAVSISVVFVPASPAQLNSRLSEGSTGDTAFFGGAGIVQGSTCVLVPSASPVPTTPTNCLVTVQKTYDANGNEQPISTVQEPANSSDLIQLTSSFADSSNPGPAHFAIDFDTPSTNTATDITLETLDCCTGKGGTKSLCSQTYFFIPNPAFTNTTDFSFNPISPISFSGNGPGTPATVTVNSLPASSLGYAGPVALSLSNVPPGISATLNQSSVTLTAGASDSTTTLTVGTAVINTTAGITSFINNLLSSGCIDNGGVANAISSKLGTAQSSINSGQIQTAINALTAFKSQVSAQAGKHIGASCALSFSFILNGQAQINSSTVSHLAQVTGSATAVNAAGLLIADAASLITELAHAATGDPITGFVLNNGLGVNGAIVSIPGAPFSSVSTDMTGFYYFPSTNLLTDGGSYTIEVTGFGGFSASSPASYTFTWTGKGQAFNFAVY